MNAGYFFSARRMADASSVGLLSYDPGGGHTDQLRDLSLALAIAELTNRRVVWPAYFHHRDVNVWTNRQVVARLARKRSRLSSIIEVVGSSVQLIEQPTTAHDFPRCDEDGENASCVVWVDPPEANASVSAALRSYAELQHAPWVHFHSLLDVLSARLARPKRYPITAWERELQPTGCFLQYRADVLATARRALRKQLGSRRRHRNSTYLAAHVRALRRRDRSKAECEAEWVPRLQHFVASALRGGSAAVSDVVSLYIASDSLRSVLPRARQALANVSARVAVVSARDADAKWAAKVHPDPELSGIVLDTCAALLSAQTRLVARASPDMRRCPRVAALRCSTPPASRPRPAADSPCIWPPCARANAARRASPPWAAARPLPRLAAAAASRPKCCAAGTTRSARPCSRRCVEPLDSPSRDAERVNAVSRAGPRGCT